MQERAWSRRAAPHARLVAVATLAGCTTLWGIDELDYRGTTPPGDAAVGAGAAGTGATSHTGTGGDIVGPGGSGSGAHGAATTTTGSGGAPLCSELASCTECFTCAVTTVCAMQYEECIPNADCAAIIDCATGCGEPDCLETCSAGHEDGRLQALALHHCVYSDVCSALCSSR